MSGPSTLSNAAAWRFRAVTRVRSGRFDRVGCRDSDFHGRDAVVEGQACGARIKSQLALQLTAGSQYGLGEFEAVGGDSRGVEATHGGVDVVLDPLQFDVTVVDDGIRRTRVAVSRLSHAAGVQDLAVTQVAMKLDVRVSDANDVGADPGESRAPEIGFIGEVLVHGIARRGVDEMKPNAIEGDRLGHRHSRQILEVRGRQYAPVLLPSLARQLAKARSCGRSHMLGDRMIVIAPDRGRRMLTHPIDAGDWLDPVLDQIADEQTGIKRLVDCTERGPVGVNVSQHQNFHAVGIHIRQRSIRHGVYYVTGVRMTLTRSVSEDATHVLAYASG